MDKDFFNEAFKNPSKFTELHSAKKCLIKNPFEKGLIAYDYEILTTLAQNPAMQSLNRENRGENNQQASPLALLLDNHPFFQNEPEHQNSRHQAFKIISPKSMEILRSYLDNAFNKRILELIKSGRGDLIQSFISPVAEKLWSELSSGGALRGDLIAKYTQPIGDMMRYEKSPDIISAAGHAAKELRSIYQMTKKNQANLLAALAFDFIDGLRGMTANALWQILSEATAFDRLRSDRNLVSGAWKESARLVPAVQGLSRSPIEDIEIANQKVPRGTNILMLYAAGNRDPKIFRDPNLFDPKREGSQLLTFGLGARSCVGKALSKIFGCAAINSLLENVSKLELLTLINWGVPGLLRTPKKLQVRIHK